ncbi:endonuclease/exonuclease/phosphatase family protein [Euzebya rosea]|uniref:endonuclease/exonuclease/phosphatase family protein n=1 Tax=Euzebya rosea TaxID=2052804 RepID=UPI000D3E942B|nr:endonuclease/exonuclease/phosphatase family protein [Euzebya rosea]
MRTALALLLPWSILLLPRVPVVGELVGVLLPVIGLAAAVAAVWVHRRRPPAVDGRAVPTVVAAATLALACVAGTVLPWTPMDLDAPRGPTVEIVSANIRSANDGDAATDELLATGADVVVTVETPILAIEGLQAVYPHRTTALPRRLGGVTVWSRYPLQRLPDLDGLQEARSVVVRVDAPAPFVLVAMHLPRPWATSRGLVGDPPHATRYEADLLTQQRLAESLAAGLADVEGPVVVAGDLNLTDRGYGYRQLTTVVDDVIRSSWALPTSTKPLFLPLRLRIDHIMVGGGWCGRSRGHVPLPGSDHDAIGAAVGPCPRTTTA